MRPDKVVITITPDGEQLDVFSGDKLLSSRKQIMESAGCSRRDRPGDIYDDIDEDYHDIAEAIDEVSLGTFSISSALYVAREEEQD